MTSSLETARLFVLILLNGFLDETELSAPPPLFLTHLLLASRINQFLDFLYIPGASGLGEFMEWLFSSLSSFPITHFLPSYLVSQAVVMN